MTTLAVHDLSKSDLIERYERMKSAGRALAKKNEMVIHKTIGLTAAGAGGAVAAVVTHFSHKALSPKIAEKVPVGVAALVDVASLFYDGDSASAAALSAFAHGWSGYLAGTAVDRILP